jgi:hypothetical protein
MAMNQYGVVKVAGSDPEEFWLVVQDSTLPSGQPVHKVLDNTLSEAVLVSELRKRGIPEAIILKLIQQARINPA